MTSLMNMPAAKGLFHKAVALSGTSLTGVNKEYAEKLGLKVMEEAGWVKREACPDDKRGYFAVMTAKGWKAIVAAAPDHVDSVRTRFLDHLTKDDQRVLAEIFERVTDSLKENPLED